MNMKKNMNIRRMGITLLTLATAFIHFTLLFPDPLFILNGLGYLVLLVLYIIPLEITEKYHNQIRWAFIAYTLITIVAWVVIGDKSLPSGAIGYVTKLIEILMVILLLLDRD